MSRALTVPLALYLACFAPVPPCSADDGTPATGASFKVMKSIALIQEKITYTKYQHFTVVNLKKGIFKWDCSGMTAWILRRSAPKARKTLPPKHPLARQFYGRIDKSPTEGHAKGWQRLEGPEDIRPGDVFAWLKPPHWIHNKNTGHVGILISVAREHPLIDGIWLVDVADASRYVHENDTRVQGGDGGFGTGTMAFAVDETGRPVAYGWYGSLQSPETFVETEIVFGRVWK